MYFKRALLTGIVYNFRPRSRGIVYSNHSTCKCLLPCRGALVGGTRWFTMPMSGFLLWTRIPTSNWGVGFPRPIWNKVFLTPNLDRVFPTPILDRVFPTPNLDKVFPTPVLVKVFPTLILVRVFPTPILVKYFPTLNLVKYFPTPILVYIYLTKHCGDFLIIFRIFLDFL